MSKDIRNKNASLEDINKETKNGMQVSEINFLRIFDIDQTQFEHIHFLYFNITKEVVNHLVMQQEPHTSMSYYGKKISSKNSAIFIIKDYFNKM